MSVFHPQNVRCRCGHRFAASAVRTLNIARLPQARTAILDGSFHVFACPACHSQVRLDKAFVYADFERNTLISVKPKNERHLWMDASQQLAMGGQSVPERVAAPDEQHMRVVFGLAELREKLVIQDAEIDDRLLELLKIFVVYEHPFLLQTPRLNLLLDQITDDAFEFIAQFDHMDRIFSISLPREVADNLIQRRDELEAWITERHQNSNLMHAPRNGDFWVNMSRWSPRVWALNYLSAFARTIEAGRAIDPGAREFATMIRYLPRGNQLPAWAKAALRTVFLYVRQNGPEELQEPLFEIRFNIALEDDWAHNNDPDDIDTLWILLRDLPDSNVEGNTFIREILLDEGKGGGWYSPGTHDIGIGALELANQEAFEDVVRHEVGHAVHQMQEAEVDDWLLQRFGWRQFSSSNTDIDAWVGLMGGWGNLSLQERMQVRQLLRQALGTQAWEPGPFPNPPPTHPWWNQNFGPRLAYEQSQQNNRWWQNNQNWYRVNGRAFSLNYYYKTFMVVDEGTINIIGAMPDNYAAMSPAEFFAELYAVFYDLEDLERRDLPDDVKQWIRDHIGLP